MTTTIRDVSGVRRLTIEADNPLNPTSVFVAGRGFTMEFDRRGVLEAVAKELGLVDPLEVMIGLPDFALPEGCNGCPMAPVILKRLRLPTAA